MSHKEGNMKYAQILKAVSALGEIQKLRLPYVKARQLYQTAKAVKNEFEFFSAEEMKLVQEYAAKDDTGTSIVSETGTITFSDINAKRKYAERINELTNMETGQFDPVIITADEIGEQTITPETIDKLDGIVIFE